MPWDAGQPHWDAICFDFDHPSLTSLARVAKARNQWPRTPIVMLASRCSCALALWGLRLGVFDLLPKPLSPADIALCMQRLQDVLLRGSRDSAPSFVRAQAESPLSMQDGRPLSPADRLQRAKAYIQLNYSRQLPLAEVANVCEMSASWFSREFKSEFGANFIEYLTSHRITHAKRLLSQTDRTVAEIATAVGFTDPAYFTRVFRRLVALSPTQFRERSVHTPIGALGAPHTAASSSRHTQQKLAV